MRKWHHLLRTNEIILWCCDCWPESVQSKVIIMLLTSVAPWEQALNSSVMPTTGPWFRQFSFESLYAVIHTDATYAYLWSIFVVLSFLFQEDGDIITVSLETILSVITWASLWRHTAHAILALVFVLLFGWEWQIQAFLHREFIYTSKAGKEFQRCHHTGYMLANDSTEMFKVSASYQITLL